jgi:adenylate cyclase
MATFGAPTRGVDDAERALQCAWQLTDEIHRWSRERARRGRAPVDVGVGLHYGEAVLGSIGDAQRLDYVVVGDTVNVASRLERLTRELDVELVVSDAVVDRLRGASLVGLRLDQLKPGRAVPLRGRMQPITIWTGPANAR